MLLPSFEAGVDEAARAFPISPFFARPLELHNLIIFQTHRLFGFHHHVLRQGFFAINRSLRSPPGFSVWTAVLDGPSSLRERLTIHERAARWTVCFVLLFAIQRMMSRLTLDRHMAVAGIAPRRRGTIHSPSAGKSPGAETNQGNHVQVESQFVAFNLTDINSGRIADIRIQCECGGQGC